VVDAGGVAVGSYEEAHGEEDGGVEYAARWGFRPNADFKLAQLVLDPPDAHPVTGQIEFSAKKVSRSS